MATPSVPAVQGAAYTPNNPRADDDDDEEGEEGENGDDDLLPVRPPVQLGMSQVTSRYPAHRLQVST